MSFSGLYNADLTAQNARTALQTFNSTLMDLAQGALPAVNAALNDFKSVLSGLRSVIPGGDGKGMAQIGARALEGAAAGALVGGTWGALGGPVGIGGGALVGGAVGGTLGVAEQFMKDSNSKGLKDTPYRSWLTKPEGLKDDPLPAEKLVSFKGRLRR